jgi:hypothetical protein
MLPAIYVVAFETSVGQKICLNASRQKCCGGQCRTKSELFRSSVPVKVKMFCLCCATKLRTYRSLAFRPTFSNGLAIISKKIDECLAYAQQKVFHVLRGPPDRPFVLVTTEGCKDFRRMKPLELRGSSFEAIHTVKIFDRRFFCFTRAAMSCKDSSLAEPNLPDSIDLLQAKENQPEGWFRYIRT